MGAAIHYLHLRRETSTRRATLMQRFFAEVYQEAFPKPDQAEGPDTWLPLMEPIVPDGQPLIHVILACEINERVRGGVIFEQYRASGCWLVTYIAVHPDARRRGLGAGLMSEVAQMIATQETAAPMIFAETENPACIENSEERRSANGRLRILDKFGMRKIPINYVQPALGAGKKALDDLLLLCYMPESDPSRIAASRLAQFLTEFYSACDQSTSCHLVRMCDALSDHEFLQLESLGSDR